MIHRMVFCAAAMALAAWAQSGIEEWAVPAGTTAQGLIQLNQPVLNRPFSATAPEEKLAATGIPGSTSTIQQKTGKKKGSGVRAGLETTVVRENLGLQTVNGVLAYGVRTSLTIPAGALGNDREIKSVKETWTCPNLHILVKSIDSDPRFGTSTYELTNNRAGRAQRNALSDSG